ncbi:hypothetical protein, partial [Bradyrhizobium macuxiense]|uniref:hypothetical protein n=1 Tax=Bradyrhizobium macuxiense TaxID=1755647 RepID=UPI001919BD7F
PASPARRSRPARSRARCRRRKAVRSAHLYLYLLARLCLSPCGRSRIACSKAECDPGEGLRSIEGWSSRRQTPHPDFPLTREIRPLPQGENPHLHMAPQRSTQIH